MGCNNIITITRQYGSGGHDIGKLLSEKLDISFYDKELITLAAKESGVSPTIFENVDERATNSLLYAMSLGLYDYGSGFSSSHSNLPVNDQLYIVQHKIIKELAEKENFVIVGRCADYILKERKNIVRVFIYADMESRTNRVLQRHDDIKPDRVTQAVQKADKARANYYSFYSGQKWGLPENYDLCINSSNLTTEQATKIILDYIETISQK